jgi:hypothetical protein
MLRRLALVRALLLAAAVGLGVLAAPAGPAAAVAHARIATVGISSAATPVVTVRGSGARATVRSAGTRRSTMAPSSTVARPRATSAGSSRVRTPLLLALLAAPTALAGLASHRVRAPGAASTRPVGTSPRSTRLRAPPVGAVVLAL